MFLKKGKMLKIFLINDNCYCCNDVFNDFEKNRVVI